MSILQYGGGGGGRSVDYAVVRSTAGQVLAPNDEEALNIDEIDHLGLSFAARVGGQLVTLAPGVYLAVCGIRAQGGAFSSGYLLGRPLSNNVVASLTGSCMSGASSGGEAVGMGLIAVVVEDLVGMYGLHTNVGDTALAGELIIVRLGPL